MQEKTKEIIFTELMAGYSQELTVGNIECIKERRNAIVDYIKCNYTGIEKMAMLGILEDEEKERL